MNKPNVFVDFHHASLLHSLILLFEKRLGGTVYRPIGEDWYTNGFWKIYDHPATVAQYLGIGGATPDGTEPLNEVIHEVSVVGVKDPIMYFCKDIDSNFANRAITFEGFKKTQFDIVLATLPQHVEPFKNLITQYQPSAKLIFQIGNAWSVEANSAPNVMASARIPNVPAGVNFIEYHQEFDLNIFSPPKYEPEFMQPTNAISSFVNCFSIDGLFAEDWALFQKVEKLMPDWKFKALGGQCRDGSANGAEAVAYEMKQSKFTWHTKRGGDGYGHIIHNTMAVGRPPIIKLADYKGKLAEDLLADGITCVAIDNLNPEQIVNKIQTFSPTPIYQELSHNCIMRFRKMVDFDREEIKIRQFLDNLK